VRVCGGAGRGVGRGFDSCPPVDTIYRDPILTSLPRATAFEEDPMPDWTRSIRWACALFLLLVGACSWAQEIPELSLPVAGPVGGLGLPQPQVQVFVELADPP